MSSCVLSPPRPTSTTHIIPLLQPFVSYHNIYILTYPNIILYPNITYPLLLYPTGDARTVSKTMVGLGLDPRNNPLNMNMTNQQQAFHNAGTYIIIIIITFIIIPIIIITFIITFIIIPIIIKLVHHHFHRHHHCVSTLL